MIWHDSDFCFCFEGVTADQVSPEREGVTQSEEESVTLKCSYETSSNNVYLYWYRQYPGQAPQYLLRKGARNWSGNEDIPDPRFDSTTSQTSTELHIKVLTLADTALYYCALRVAQWYKVSEMLYKNSEANRQFFNERDQSHFLIGIISVSHNLRFQGKLSDRGYTCYLNAWRFQN